MKPIWILFVGLAVFAGVMGVRTAEATHNFTGIWAVQATITDGPEVPVFDPETGDLIGFKPNPAIGLIRICTAKLIQAGGAVSGTISCIGIGTATISAGSSGGGAVGFTGGPIAYFGTFAGDGAGGVWTGTGPDPFSGVWSAQRKARATLAVSSQGPAQPLANGIDAVTVRANLSLTGTPVPSELITFSAAPSQNVTISTTSALTGSNGIASADLSSTAVGNITVTVCTPDLCGEVNIQFFNHYRVQLKSWIPHAEVVDPILPVRLPYLIATVRSEVVTECPLPSLPGTLVYSRFQGDNHNGFAGGYRVISTVEFDWNGEAISNFILGGSPSPTHLKIDYTARGSIYTSCGADGLAVQSPTGQTDGSSFELSYRVSNPLVFLSPPIDGTVSGGFREDGTLDLVYATDSFPSHGIEVFRNDVRQLTAIVNDASCLSDREVLGLTGVRNLTAGLTFDRTSGILIIPPGQSGASSITPSSLCR